METAPLFRQRVQSVLEKVEHHLSELARITEHLGEVGGELEHQLRAGGAGELSAEKVSSVVDAAGDRETPALFGTAAPGELKEALDDPLAAERALLDEAEALHVRRAASGLASHQLDERE